MEKKPDFNPDATMPFGKPPETTPDDSGESTEEMLGRVQRELAVQSRKIEEALVGAFGEQVKILSFELVSEEDKQKTYDVKFVVGDEAREALVREHE